MDEKKKEITIQLVTQNVKIQFFLVIAQHEYYILYYLSGKVLSKYVFFFLGGR